MSDNPNNPQLQIKCPNCNNVLKLKNKDHSAEQATKALGLFKNFKSIKINIKTKEKM